MALHRSSGSPVSGMHSKSATVTCRMFSSDFGARHQLDRPAVLRTGDIESNVVQEALYAFDGPHWQLPSVWNFPLYNQVRPRRGTHSTEPRVHPECKVPGFPVSFGKGDTISEHKTFVPRISVRPGKKEHGRDQVGAHSLDTWMYKCRAKFF